MLGCLEGVDDRLAVHTERSEIVGASKRRADAPELDHRGGLRAKRSVHHLQRFVAVPP